MKIYNFLVIDKSYFEELGMYDPEYEIWGAENLELAFKVWMCHGSVEVIPCSHAAHLFRKKFPYQWPKNQGNIVKRNTDRLANVWLDEYIRFYHRKTGVRNDFGDITAVSSILILKKSLMTYFPDFNSKKNYVRN
jgi:polypeptide N-acetylgalactosaminyltransferase